jgi:hypothetical protein
MHSGFWKAAACCALIFAQPAMAAGMVSSNAGPMTGQGTLQDSSGRSGQWSIRAVLKDGNFTGEGTLLLNGATFTGPLIRGLSFVENGKCYFAFQKDRARVSLGGPCTTDSLEGKFDGFLPGEGIVMGEAKGNLRFGQGSTAAIPDGVLPTGKLTCAWWETQVTYKVGELNTRQLRNSNMVTLTLSSNGTYRTANTAGAFVRDGSRIRLISGAYSGAVGQLRPDRSGAPAVYFERNENLRPSGVHIVDPATTACTKARV